MPEYILGSYTFPTKAAAITEVRDVLHTARTCEPLTGHEHHLIAALVARHPHADEKIGTGIDHIDVRTMDGAARAFWITRTDGTLEVFSYRKCFDGPRTRRAAALAAMRRAIDPQILAFRREEFHRIRSAGEQAICPLTGNTLRDDPTTHVDHDGDGFAALAEQFADAYGGLDNIPTRPAPDYSDEIADPDIWDAWDMYHRTYAQLRLLHRAANLARLARH